MRVSAEAGSTAAASAATPAIATARETVRSRDFIPAVSILPQRAPRRARRHSAATYQKRTPRSERYLLGFGLATGKGSRGVGGPSTPSIGSRPGILQLEPGGPSGWSPGRVPAEGICPPEEPVKPLQRASLPGARDPAGGDRGRVGGPRRKLTLNLR